MDDRLRTVAGAGRSEFTIRGSRFVGHVAPADSVDGAESFVATVRADHPDATHVVPAHRVRVDGLVDEWASDDGEPSGSAGPPALTVLQRRELENVAAAVVRWYGGTNLGVGGLARAYARGVGDAIEAAGVVEREPMTRLRATVTYDDSGTVRSVLESAGRSFDADYDERVQFDVLLPATAAADLRDRLLSATGGRVDFDAGN